MRELEPHQHPVRFKIIAGSRTIPRVRVQHLFRKTEFLLPPRRFPIMIPAASLLSRSIRHPFEAPPPVVPEPVHLGVGLECRHRRPKIIRDQFIHLLRCATST